MTTKPNYTADDFDPIKIRQYLQARGWVQSSTKRERMLFFRHPNNEYGQFYLPLETGTPGFLRGIEEIIYVLTKFEKRPESDIVTNLMYPDNDIVRYRICSLRAESGMISLSVADQLIGAVTKSLKATVCDVVSPNRHHPRLKRKETDSFLEHTQFAQTERGSFIVKLLCPLNSLDTPEMALFQDKETPLARHVTSHLMITAANIISTIDSGQEGQFIDRIKKDVKKERVSADFCRAIADIQIWDDASLELTTQWAPILENQDAPNRVEIHKNYFPRIAEIADALMPPPQEQSSEVFFASVEMCGGEENDDYDREGLVVLRILNSEEGVFKANVMLSPEQYKIANEVHMGRGKYCLVFEGKLLRKSRSCEIVEISNFSKVSLANNAST